MNPLVTFLIWAVWWGGVVLVIKVEKRRDKAIQAEGNVNFEDKSITGYLLLGLICGGLILPVYFYATHKTGKAAGVGVLLGIGIMIVALLVGTAGLMITGVPVR